MKFKTTFLALVLTAIPALAQSGKAVRNVGRNVNAITPITASIAFQGYEETQPFVGQAEYEIYADNVDGIIDKPIILLDGFDPNDGRAIPAIYGLLNYGTGQNLADDLRNLGYDVIILNFPNYTRPADGALISGGSDYIERNAMVLVELLNQVNAMKVGTEQNVVIGPSMGGLIARYALRYMEMNSLTHDTRLYVSFDAPHRGANIPIGFQHLFNYMAYGPLGDATVQVLVDAMIRSNASRQMLIDQFEGHLQSGSPTEFDPAILLPTGKPGFRDFFQAELDAMGLPQNTRNIAIANGSSNGTTNGTPGMAVMDHTFNITSTQRAIINLKFAPAANQTVMVSRFRGQANVFSFWITVYESAANSMAPTTSDGLDSAPGGKFDISSLAGVAGSNALLTEFFDNLNVTSFDFVPTRSSLALSDSLNWYLPVDASSSPFDAVNMPTENENHVTLTTTNMAFVLNEILNPLGVAHVAFGGLEVQNPVGSSINVYTPNPITNATLEFTDISGKLVLSRTHQNFEGSFSIDAPLSQGMYFLTIRNSSGSITKKLIKS
ncbi:MAG: T9SS type A sorting domain-containing protein [Flavobacterium sp.]|nr:MAG: T9SS type A sorting domain-containing protein [Flavobacterium sp.]